MNFRLLLIALLLPIWSLVATTTTTEINSDAPIRGQIFHPGNDQQFNEMLSRFELVVVDFYADWCGPCKQMHKVIEDLAADRECEDILFIKINTDVYRGLSHHFGITGLPTVILFVDGKPITRLHGYQSKKDLKAAIKNAFRVPKA